MRYPLQYQKNCGGREDAPIHGTINHSLFETKGLDQCPDCRIYRSSSRYDCPGITGSGGEEAETRQRSSAADVFRPQIATWLDQNLPVIRMLELAREDHDHPYTGSETAFYDYVRKMRRARHQTPRNVALRFEGVPGEYLQIDWGEVRDFPFTKAGMEQQTRYFFAARLKYSRYMYVCEFSH